jgi:hypothetical protein
MKNLNDRAPGKIEMQKLIFTSMGSYTVLKIAVIARFFK